MRIPSIAAAALLLTCISAGAASAQSGCDLIVFDGDFADADWTHTELWDTNGTASFVVGQELTGGNPDSYQEGTHTLHSTDMAVGHILDSAPVDPSTFSIGALEYEFDYKVVAGGGACGSSSLRVSGNVLLEQGGVHYRAQSVFTITTSSGWYHFESGPLVAIDFGEVTTSAPFIDTSSNPDFGPTGAPIRLGYISSNSTGQSSCSRTFGTDNFQVTVRDPGPGTRYCGGTSLSCPCGNDSDQGGCLNSTGAGGRLRACGSTSVSADDLVLAVSSLSSGQPGLVYAGPAQIAVPFGDGVRCVGGTVIRFPVRTPDASGAFDEGPGLAASAGFGAGQSWNFQAWYRDPAGPCAAAFNLSDAYQIAFTL